MFRTFQLAPHVKWLDNFSKFLPRILPAANLDLFKSCLWTVVGCRPLNLMTTPLTLVLDVPAMPSSFLSVNFVERIKEAFKAAETSSEKRYSGSVTKDMTRVPLEESKPHNQRAVHQARFIPLDLQNVNIGSNIRLVKIMEDLRVNEQVHPSSCYELYSTDINIFNRMLKVRLTINILTFFSLCMIRLSMVSTCNGGCVVPLDFGMCTRMCSWQSGASVVVGFPVHYFT
jgi:hypothetical protein